MEEIDLSKLATKGDRIERTLMLIDSMENKKPLGNCLTSEEFNQRMDILIQKMRRVLTIMQRLYRDEVTIRERLIRLDLGEKLAVG